MNREPDTGRARGLIELAFDVVEQTTHLVERTHDAVVERSWRWLEPVQAATSTAGVVRGLQAGISRNVFESIRAVNKITRFTTNAAADLAEAHRDRMGDSDAVEVATAIASTAPETASRYADNLQSALNGFWGDHLSSRKSLLALGMTLRHEGRQVPPTTEAFAAAFPEPTNKVCVFVHSLAATESLWNASSEKHYGTANVTFGTRLRDDLGFTPIYLRYNTGRHISENGRALAALLTEALAAYPVPVEQIALVGHSMGGLVARSAAHYAREHGEAWIGRLHHVVCIGTPNLGAPLEKSVNLLTRVLRRIDAAGAQVPAELLETRSSGIKDLRHGYTVDEEWAGKDPDEAFGDARQNIPLVSGVGYHFLAATISRDPDHPLGQLLGDLLVRLPSASGQAREPGRRIHFSGGSVFPGMNHFDMANHPDVYEALRDLLA